MNNTKSRCFAGVLYPEEDKRHYEALNYIIKSNIKYAMIEHDKDIMENGENKKKHIHLIIKFENARSLESVSKEIGIEKNYMEKAKFVAYTQYLIHKNDKDKYQYDKNEIYTNMKEEVESALNYKGDYGREDTAYIIDFIYNNKIKNFKELVFWAKNQGLLKEITKNAYLYNNILRS